LYCLFCWQPLAFFNVNHSKEAAMAHTRYEDLGPHDLIWESAKKSMRGAIVDSDGMVYLRSLKIDGAPALPTRTEEERRAVSDLTLLRLIAALTSDAAYAGLLSAADDDRSTSVSNDDDIGASTFDPEYRERMIALRRTMRRIHAEASAAAPEGLMLQLRAEVRKKPIAGVPDDRVRIAERRKRLSPLLEPLLKLFQGLSAEDIDFDPERTIRVPIKGFKYLVSEDLPLGEQVDRLEYLLASFSRQWNEKGNEVTVGGRPDMFEGWIQIELPEAKPTSRSTQPPD
jgi:hypothetical protein